jgi:hypothetical protein
MSSFCVQKKPERLQFFGSTVDRFGNTNNTSNLEHVSNIGPGSYNVSNVSNLMKFHKKAANTVFSGFNCTQERFADNSYKEITPGPGSYNNPTTEQPAT